MTSTARRPLLHTLLANSVLVMILFVGTWAMHGRVAAVRCGVTLVMPVSLVWLGLFAAFVWHWSSKKRAVAISFLALFVLWGIVGGQTLMQWASRHVEPPLTAQPDPAFENRFERNHFDAIVVLGGATQQPMRGFAEVGGDGERILSAAQAWHAGITRALIVTGSATHGDEHPRKESRQLLQSLGIPKDRIFEIEGVNTTAEMQSLQSFLESPPEAFTALASSPLPASGKVAFDSGSPLPASGSDDLLSGSPLPASGRGAGGEGFSLGLITSAFHIPRAMRIATSEGLQLEPLPCAFRSKHSTTPWSPADLVPNAARLSELALMLKEIIARQAGQ